MSSCYFKTNQTSAHRDPSACLSIQGKPWSCWASLVLVFALSTVAAPAAAGPASLPEPIAIPTPFIPFPPIVPLLPSPRDAQARPLLFSFVTNQAGFDTRIVIENTTKDALNTSQQTGTCTIRYYGSAAPASQLSSSVPAGDSIEFTLSSGGTKNIAATPGFQGYIIADCTFPLARGYSFLSDMGGTTFLAAEPAEVLMAPRGNIARPLLFSFVSNQAGLDTGIAIANTSLDGLGSTPQNGTCTIRYFGTMAGGGPVPAPQTSSSIQAGNQLVFTISSGGTHGIMAAPGFQGYITATCTFPHARGYSFLSDLGVMKFGSAQHAEVLTLPRGTTPKPLLFRFATNQAGFDTAIAISNTSNDGLGTAASSGTCSIRYYGHTAAGGPAPSTQTSAAIPAGKQLVFSLSNGGSYGIAATPGFQGYIIASCSFAHARGQSLVSDLGMLKLVASETAEVINTPRDQIPRPLLFSYVSNQSGWDTGIAIANTSLDPVGSTPQSGTCTLRYYGVTAGGLPAPAAQTSTAIPAGETLVFTLSSGGSYGISAAVGFKGYIMAHCNFPLARGYSFISDIGAMNYATALIPEIIIPFDADGDGTPDNTDSCPTNPSKTVPGQCGCSTADTDSDGDGTANCNDACASDPLKTQAGICGCGVADSDSDGDATADCLDSCPANPQKTHPGICGCGLADTDSDGDGTLNCSETCPNDPAKTDPGVCGCGYTDSDKNGDGVVDCGTSTSGLCIPGPSGAMDCAEEVLASAACAGANSFLGQINIATVLNLLSSPLNFTVKYIDAGGTVRGQVSTALAGNLKADFIINDLGLTPDTYGTVCVETDAAGDGAWTGGIALYKPNRREGPKPFGADFDFAIYHPFTNPRQGSMTVPLNTFHLGVNPADPVANWISITDATVGDGQGLSGKLRYYNSLGSLTKEDLVLIADGGRFDFSGHEGIAGLNSQDAVGMARFVPDAISSGAQAKYYLTVSRYFYDCAGTSCTNFLTAFSLPHRPGTEAKITGRASSLNGELSVLELTNTATSPAAAQYKLYAANGTLHGSGSAAIPVLGTTHIILNQAGASGYLPADSLGSIEVDAVSGYVSASILHYNFNASGELLYAYATPLVGPQKALQVSQFNSFIEHTNSLEAYNPTSISIALSLDFVDYDGSHLYSVNTTIAPFATVRFDALLQANHYGTVNVQANQNGLITRSFVARNSQYVLPFEAH